MALIVKKNIGLFVTSESAYAKITNVSIETNPELRMAVKVGFYVSKEAREKDIVKKYIQNKLEPTTYKSLPEDFPIDQELKVLMGMSKDTDYLDYFSKCFYTPEQIKIFIQDGFLLNSGSILNEFTFYIYNSENPFPADLSISNLKNWVYTNMKTEKAYMNALYTPGHPEYLDTISDDLESEESVIARHKEIYSFL